MKTIGKRTLLCVMSVLTLTMLSAHAGGGGNSISLAPFKEDLSDQASLQRGAKYFMNYCSGCHELRYVRYERMAKDIGITRDDGQVAAKLMKANLMFTSDKIGDTIRIAMRNQDSKKWFGVAPPDLSLVTRARGAQWVYDYLLGFYTDAKRPWGVNNVMFPDVAMPNVLADLHGEQEPIYRADSQKKSGTIIGLRQSKPGLLSEQAYQQQMTDLVNFLVYAADPVKKTRERLGVWVILLLTALLAFAFLLKREYWKDVH